jgi:hypothetical protein
MNIYPGIMQHGREAVRSAPPRPGLKIENYTSIAIFLHSVREGKFTLHLPPAFKKTVFCPLILFRSFA